MFMTNNRGEGPRPGAQLDNCYEYQVDDLRVCQAADGFTEHSPSVVTMETAWLTIAAKKAVEWYRGGLQSRRLNMVRWHENEATLSKKHHASVARVACKKMRRRVGNGPRKTEVDESRKETADSRLARHQTDQWAEPMYVPQTAATAWKALCCVFICSRFLSFQP